MQLMRVFGFFLLAVFLSSLFGFLGVRSEMLQREGLVVLYSAGVFLSALVFRGKFQIFSAGSRFWVVFSFFLPVFYLLLPFLFAGEMPKFYSQPFSTSIAIVATTFIAAFFEEVGWRGFLFDALSNSSWTTKNLLIGLMWAAWHYPPIFVGSYLVVGEPVVTILIFTLNVVLLSFIIGWFREKTGSILAPVLLHASHNLFYHFSGVYAPISESGMLLSLAFMVVLFVLKAWRKPLTSASPVQSC